MSEEEINKLVNLRQHLVERYSRVKDYRQNKNAIMREWDHAELVHEVIVKLDVILKEYVNFETK